MNDQIETATEALSESGITFGPAGATAVTSLAIYGALSLTRDATRFTKKVIQNRKAKKAAEKAVVETPQQ